MLERVPGQIDYSGIGGLARRIRDPFPRVQVPNNHILTQSQYYNHYDPKPQYLIIGYMDTLGFGHF